ncbi:MAG: hypothetical protein JWO80_1403 [Bryobacterales bacterium]|nr:hypothetical protein [Bryobacterales bacterium]
MCAVATKSSSSASSVEACSLCVGASATDCTGSTSIAYLHVRFVMPAFGILIRGAFLRVTTLGKRVRICARLR